MAFLVSALLPFVVAGLMAFACVLPWRELLTKPLLYGFASFLLLLGMHYLVKALVEFAKFFWPLGQGYFLVSRPTTERAITAIERQMTIEGLAVAAAVALLSYPLLVLIRGGFEK